jgi:hypothetical protein
MNREPMPDWTRPGETWRVETERGGWVTTTGGVCSGTGCFRRAIVLRPALSSHRGKDFMLCELHVRSNHMWIEGGQVVSWCLRP